MADFIRLESVTFSYPPAQSNPALSRLSLHISQGEMAALIGTNGSGKSTLAKLLNALLLPASGKVISAGLDTTDPANHTAIRSRVGMVFQRPQDQIVASTVEEEIAFGPANLGLPPREVRERVEQALSVSNLQDLRERHPFFLSAGEAQRLALAGVLAMRPDCIIFDESTAMLDPANRAALMDQAIFLNQQGITILMITHLMDEAAQCGRVIVLHQGQLAMDGPPSTVFSRATELEALGLDQPIALKAADHLRKFFPAMGRNILSIDELINALPPYSGSSSAANEAPHAFNQPTSAQPVIDVDKLSHTYPSGAGQSRPALDHLSLQVQEGHTHGLIGMSGSGKSTLLQHLNALIRPQSGHVKVGHFHLNDQDLDTRALRRMVALAFQQPEDQIFEHFVGDEIAYGPRNLGYTGKLADVVRKAMHAVGLNFDAYKDRLTSELSGGERRKVALASILAVRAQILLLDEPLAGLDPQSRRQVLRLLGTLHQSGKTLLISTHQYEELSASFNVISLLHQGKDILHGAPQHVFSQQEILDASGIMSPFHTLIARALRNQGWPIQPAIADQAALDAALDRVIQGAA
jgi:energy-coupling factor transport system ATP-binding protein